MNKNVIRHAGLVLAGLCVVSSCWSIEFKGAPRSPVTSAASVSSPSGIVTKIDAGSGVLVLDGTRRFAFTPGAVMVGKRSGGSGKLAEVKEGMRVSLTVVKNSEYASPRVTELWIGP